ncbi:unnamed protein product, partial [marine sediment metagenome]
DQGAAAFTASQYIRVYAGTYDENVVPNSSLTPNLTHGYLLVIEGDPADDRENIKIDPAAGHGISAGCDQILVRHLWVDVTGSSYCLYSNTLCHVSEVLDCKLTAVASTGAVRCEYGVRIEGCEITLSGDGRAVYSSYSGYTIKACKITGPGKATSTMPAIQVNADKTPPLMTIEGTVISGFECGMYVIDNRTNGVRVLNTTFHDCVVGIKTYKATCSPEEVVDCVFKDCTYIYQVGA